MNGLAYIGKVVSTGDIPGADHIVQARVVCGKGGAWAGVVRKDEIKTDDIVEVYLPDSILPAHPRFAFMEPKKYRVRQAKFKGCPSTCLVMPNSGPYNEADIGLDITEVREVTKYEKAIPATMAGQVKGNFPAFIPKTDELHYQKAGHLIDALRGKSYYVTLKFDGCSGTAYLKDGRFGVCSRNLELKEEGGGVWWEVAKKYNLEAALRGWRDNIAIQFEVVGPGIQGNPLGLKERELRLFDIYDIAEGKYTHFHAILWHLPSIPMVETLLMGYRFDPDDIAGQSMADYANGVKYGDKPGEGIVIRPLCPRMVGSDRLSFKVINLNYKD